MADYSTRVSALCRPQFADLIETGAELVETRERLHSPHARFLIVTRKGLLGREPVVCGDRRLQLFERVLMRLLPAKPVGIQSSKVPEFQSSRVQGSRVLGFRVPGF